MGDIIIQVKRVSELTECDKENFYQVFESVYGNDEYIEKKFEKKYIENIYGESILVFAFSEEKCIGIQAFLRNDLFGQEAYQSGDSATLEECRGKGVFTSMVKSGVEKIPRDAFVYGFPNNNSLPAFKKMGWNIGTRKKYKLCIGKDKNSIDEIDVEYLEWMTKVFCNLFYFKWQKYYYILKKRKCNLYQVVGKTAEGKVVEEKMQHVLFPILIIYSDKGTLGNGMVPIWIGENKIGEIPVYKMDTILTE